MNRLVCGPLTSVSALLAVCPTPDEETPPAVPSLLLFPINSGEYAAKLQDSQKILVCHDMRGNYLNDKYINGAAFENAFQMFDFDSIHIFCYFSHELVSIPPLSWVNCCRTHGVRVLGTLITEWEEGEQRCRDLFGSREACVRAAVGLTRAAIEAGIEGWLINIENKLEPLELVDNVIFFLNTLTGMMREAVPNGEVIWYDAVTSEGRLEWQDTVSDLNVSFASACSGLFVNYTWKPTTPAAARLYIERLASSGGAAGGQMGMGALYFGCDVFGRGTAFGGGYDSHKAVSCAMESGASVAIFAPGWALEGCVQDGTAEHSFDCIQSALVTASVALWRPIAKARRMAVPRQSVHTIARRTLPLCTYFGLGAGKSVFVCGQRFPHWGTCNRCSGGGGSSSGAFYDLSMQDFRFNADVLSTKLQYAVTDGGGFPCVAECSCSLSADVGFLGSSSLLVSTGVAAQTGAGDGPLVHATPELLILRPSVCVNLPLGELGTEGLIVTTVLGSSQDLQDLRIGLRLKFALHSQSVDDPVREFKVELHLHSINGSDDSGVSAGSFAPSVSTVGSTDMGVGPDSSPCACRPAPSRPDSAVLWTRVRHELSAERLLGLSGGAPLVLEEVSLVLPTQGASGFQLYLGALSVVAEGSQSGSGSDCPGSVIISNAYMGGDRIVCDLTWKNSPGPSREAFYVFRHREQGTCVDSGGGTVASEEEANGRPCSCSTALLTAEEARSCCPALFRGGCAADAISVDSLELIGRTRAECLRLCLRAPGAACRELLVLLPVDAHMQPVSISQALFLTAEFQCCE